MKQLVNLTLFASLLLGSSVAHARPAPPQPGVCYYFKKQELQRQRPCSIQHGYGAGGHYTNLTWADGSETGIIKVNFCKAKNYDNEGFCEYEVNNKPARRLYLDIFLMLSSEPLLEGDKAGNCFEIKASQETFCHSLSE